MNVLLQLNKSYVGKNIRDILGFYFAFDYEI